MKKQESHAFRGGSIKYLVLFTALIALLSCGSGSNPISPNPSVDTSQSAEKNESPVMENPLVEPPGIVGDPPPVPVLEPPEEPEVVVDPEIEAIIEAIIRELPIPPEVIVEPPEEFEVVVDPEIEAIIEAIIRELPEPPEDPPPDQE